jgi:hypothetical protein
MLPAYPTFSSNSKITTDWTIVPIHLDNAAIQQPRHISFILATILEKSLDKNALFWLLNNGF